MEEWKDIKGYEGFYQISSYGNVKSLVTNKVLTGDTNGLGYRRVWLYAPVAKRMFIHRLVALHFCEGYSEEKVVNHKDGNKTNNRADNLEWVTRSENDLHAFRLGLRTPQKTSKPKYIVKLLNKDTGELIKTFKTIKEFNEEFGFKSGGYCYEFFNGKIFKDKYIVVKEKI